MAKFEHKRYPALTLQDDKGVWAQFSPEERSFGEHTVRVGVLTTDDPKLIARLREATTKDSDLAEAGASVSVRAESGGEVPAGSIAEVLAWVGGDPERAAKALEAEQAGKQRSTLIADLEQITDGE